MRQAAVCVGMIALGLAMGCKPRADAAVTQMGNLDGNARLSASVVPLSYDLDLRIDPRGEEEGALSGRAVIRVRVDAPTSTIAMHAEGMAIGRAVVDGEEARALFGKNGGLELEASSELGVGEHVLELSWEAALDGAPEGLYRVKSGEDWYAFTQFEPLEAREAFPCFDEPGFKTPFEVTVEVPDGMMAAANAPSVGAPEALKEGGFTRYAFAKTKPLPTYLVAFAVGPFGVVEAPDGAIPGVPLRALVPKGKEALAGYVLEHTPEILANLEGYFGQAYPYEKLDLVAVPNFRFGAMENVGLVTFRESLMLIDAGKSTAREQYALRSVTAHELAHMWFGNFVTPTWWDELWLNESFATWMASKVMEELYPESEEPVRRVRGVRWVMGADSLEGTRAIRQPITNGGDVYNAFDGITYGKGAAVLRMTERWIGAEAMREGVRAYMKANPHGSVETESLMKALEEASGKPVYAVLRTFLDQPGVPVLEGGDVVCGDGGATLAVKQSRYLPAGTGASKEATSWSIPACVKYEGADGALYQTCEVLEGSESLIKLESCPAWVFLNADVGGYYMWNTSSQGTPEVTSPAVFSALTRAERIAAVGNLKKLLEAEVIEPGAFFDAVLPQLASSDDLLASEGLGALGMMAAPAREAGELEAYAALVRAGVGPLVERLGLEPAEGEAPDVGRLRISALGMLARWGQDAWAMGNARGLIGAFTAEPDAMPSWRARWVVPLAASRGDERLWEELLAALPRAKSPRARSRVLSGLGSFEEPALLERSLELALTDDIYGSEIWALYGPSMNDEATRELAWVWFTSRYDAIAKKLGEGALADMPYFGSGFCDEAGRAKVEAFFGPKAQEVDGMKRNLSMVLEGIELCVRARGYVREAALERVRGAAE